MKLKLLPQFLGRRNLGGWELLSRWSGLATPALHFLLQHWPELKKCRKSGAGGRKTVIGMKVQSVPAHQINPD